MVFTPTNRQKTAFNTAGGIANPLNQRQQNRYGTLLSTDKTKAYQFGANKLGLTGYDPTKAQLDPLQRYRFQQMKTTNPNMARTYRTGVLARNTANAAPAETAPATTPAAPATNPVVENLFPKGTDLTSFNANNYMDPKNDVLTNFRIDQGQKALDRTLAAKGALGSGAGLRASSDLISRINAEEGDKMYDRGLTQAQMAQTGAKYGNDYKQEIADRLERMATNESNRKTNAGNAQWDRKAWVIEQLLNQNPLGTAFGASQGQSDLYAKLGAMLSAGGGGGGGGSEAPIPMPFPSVNYGDSNVYGIGADSSYNTDLMGSLGDLLSKFF